jgi:uncharacterized peroxidase-related enzyme
VAAVVSDYRAAPLLDSEKALLDFAVALTREPAGRDKADIDALRKAGWSDRAILDATLITAYFAFVNRIADGLGVELEEHYTRSSETPTGQAGVGTRDRTDS